MIGSCCVCQRAVFVCVFIYCANPINILKMEQHDYQEITADQREKSSKTFLRQLLVVSAVWISLFATGLGIGASTVIIPQVRKEANSTNAISPEMASWISSVNGYAALPWVIIFPFISSNIGRKYPYYFVSICTFISYLVMYCSNTGEYILLSAIIRGPVSGSNITIALIIVTEYSSPKNRGLFLTLKSATFNWGIWVANALGTFFHWKTISIAGMLCSAVNLVTILFWCESPYWLASKYKYEACSKSHRWLKGNSLDSKGELSGLIRTSREYQNQCDSQQFILRTTFQSMLKREFYKPLFLCMALLALYHGSGKLVCSIYAIDIIKSITSNESTAYTGMLILDGVTVTGMYIGSGLSKVFKRRAMLITTTLFGITFLFILSLYLWLIYLLIIIENKYISLALLTLFSFGLSCGPMILASSIYGELIPQKYKTCVMIIVGLFTETMISSFLKFAPLMFLKFKMHGAFLFYGIVASTLLTFIYKYLPETKDKTLQEISASMLNQIEVQKKTSFVQTESNLL